MKLKTLPYTNILERNPLFMMKHRYDQQSLHEPNPGLSGGKDIDNHSGSMLHSGGSSGRNGLTFDGSGRMRGSLTPGGFV